MVTANASLAFVGNIDDSVEVIVHSHEHDLFKPLHKVFDLAILDRFHTYLPGWEIPKNKDESLTRRYGLIIEYVAEAFHHLARKTNRFAYAKSVCRLGKGYDQRDQTAVLKTVCAFLKILHPGSDPTPEELDEYLEYAIEGRRRVKEQLNKRKPDEEFAHINLSFVRATGEETIVYCPESKAAEATQSPLRVVPSAERATNTADTEAESRTVAATPPVEATVAAPMPATAIVVDAEQQPAPKERHYRIHYGATGYSYASIFGEYLAGASEITIEDPYIRTQHQIINFLRFCETVVRIGEPKKIILVTTFDNEPEKDEAMAKLFTIADSLKQFEVELQTRIASRIHDREVRMSNGWTIKIGRGFDIYQRPDDWLTIGANDLDLRPCLETIVDVFRRSE